MAPTRAVGGGGCGGGLRLGRTLRLPCCHAGAFSRRHPREVGLHLGLLADRSCSLKVAQPAIRVAGAAQCYRHALLDRVEQAERCDQGEIMKEATQLARSHPALGRGSCRRLPLDKPAQSPMPATRHPPLPCSTRQGAGVEGPVKVTCLAGSGGRMRRGYLPARCPPLTGAPTSQAVLPPCVPIAEIS